MGDLDGRLLPSGLRETYLRTPSRASLEVRIFLARGMQRQAMGRGRPWSCHGKEFPECPCRLMETRAIPDPQESRCQGNSCAQPAARKGTYRLSVLSLESVPDEVGDLLAVHLDAAAHRVGDENPVLVVDLDCRWPPELLFSL
jgi:hypothetical protein